MTGTESETSRSRRKAVKVRKGVMTQNMMSSRRVVGSVSARSVLASGTDG